MRFSTTLAMLLALTACGGNQTAQPGQGPGGAAAESPLDTTPEGKLLATVGNGGVTEADFTERAIRSPGAATGNLDDAGRKEVLDRLITEEALWQESIQHGLYRDPKVRKIMVNLLLREEIYANVSASDFSPEQLQAYFEKHRDEFVVPEKVQVKRIFLRIGPDRDRDAAMAMATDFRNQLLTQPEKFKELAVEHSEGPYKRRGGDLGYLSREGKPGIDPTVVSAAFELKPGEVSEPFEAAGGVNLVTVASKRERVERTFEQMKGSVLRKLKNEKYKELTDGYIETIKAKYPITVDQEAVSAVDLDAARRNRSGSEEDPEVPDLDQPIPPGVDRLQGATRTPPSGTEHPVIRVALLWALVSSPASAAVVDRIAAVVEDEVIAESEIYELGTEYIKQRCPAAERVCVHEMELEVLDALIKRVLIREELINLGMRVTGQEIDQAIDTVIRENGMEDRQALRSQLEQEGIDWNTFREDLADQLRLQRFQQGVLMPRVVVSEDELQDIYKRTERSSRQPEVQLDAMGILIPAEEPKEEPGDGAPDEAPEPGEPEPGEPEPGEPEAGDPDGEGTTVEADADWVKKAERLVAALNAEEPTITWEEAVEKNDSAGLAEMVGGQRYQQGQLTEAVDAAAFAGEVGEVVGPVRVGNVLFILKINERGLGKARVVPFEEIRDQLQMQLFQQKLTEAEEEWYQRSRRLSAVEILLEKPE